MHVPVTGSSGLIGAGAVAPFGALGCRVPGVAGDMSKSR